MYIDDMPIAPYTLPWEYRVIELDGKQYRFHLTAKLPEGAKVIKDYLEPGDREICLPRYR